MNIKKIAAVCKARGRASLVNVADGDGVVRQYIDAKGAWYPVTGLPLLTESNIPTLFSLSAKDLDNMVIAPCEAPEWINFSDIEKSETNADELPITVTYTGLELMLFQVNGETFVLDKMRLDPILKDYKEDVELWLRGTKDKPYFAVKVGLMVVGIVLPMPMQGGLMGLLENAVKGYNETRYDYAEIGI